ncbi:MAG: alpha/beta hydrolase [Chloroflexi bacterium]|nr:alpha/beta hydrolase [Chloroflexota bacterium]
MPFATLSKVRLHYYERGYGPAQVVFVHGFQASGRIWQLVQEALPEDQYHSIAIDNRGAGQSDAPPDEADFAIECFAGDIHEVVTQLEMRDFTLVGHSMGGGTVARYAVDHPEMLKALVLLDPSDPDGREMSADEIDAFLDARMAARSEQRARGGGGDGIIPADEGGSGDFLRLLGADMAAAPERRLRGSMRSLLNMRLGGAVAALPIPVLLACGDQDELIPLAAMLATWAKYPKGTGLKVWHGAGHSPNVEMPGEVAALLRQFIERTVPSRRTLAGAV